MKRKFEKKLVLSKATVATLDRGEMNRIIGASIMDICTQSCSIMDICCTPTRNYALEQVKAETNR